MGMYQIAILWGFAEGTLFFFVPDVFLSAAGLVDSRRSVIACFYTLAGSLLGGTVMYFWGIKDPVGILQALDAIPGISLGMIGKVQTDLADLGAWGVFKGPLGGVPYKIYASQAHPAGVGLVWFLLASIPARLGRFLAVTYVAPKVIKLLGPKRSTKQNMAILLVAWAVFYVFYFISKSQ